MSPRLKKAFEILTNGQTPCGRSIIVLGENPTTGFIDQIVVGLDYCHGESVDPGEDGNEQKLWGN
jgi:hypothetical protein